MDATASSAPVAGISVANIRSLFAAFGRFRNARSRCGFPPCHKAWVRRRTCLPHATLSAISVSGLSGIVQRGYDVR
jgi:hypothetical protein